MASFRRVMVAAATIALFFSQVTWTLAGTTGGLSGVVTDASNGAPLAGVTVTVSSPSGGSSTTTDARGNYRFISLSPDTYALTTAKDQYTNESIPGVTIFADSTQVVNVRMTSLKTIARVTSTTAGSLVKAGTTSDVYSVNAATQEKVAAVGGGGGLNNAYSAIATVPGVYVPMNQTGYFQTVHVRGGDFDQLGYEVDGVPVNRSFDNYPGGTASSLGQQELQVYTGATPANSEGQGLAGYINQVIKTGSYPGYAQATLGLGGPSFYHHAAVEAGGASPDRRFSYYIGVGGYNNDNFLYVDKNQGDQYLSNWGNVIGTDANGNYLMSPFNAFSSSGLANRDVVANFHFALPHRKDGGRDDLQLLFSNQFLKTTFYDSTNDVGSGIYNAEGSFPSYFDGLTYTGSLGASLPSNFASLQQTYLFPDSPTDRCANVPAPFTNACPTGTTALIDPNLRDSIYNDQSIFKLQYQKNWGSDAYLRVYGYSFYSDWLQTGPQTAFANYFGPVGPNYLLATHTYGGSAVFSKQFSAEHLVSLQGNYTQANVFRDNNRTFYDLFGFGGATTTLAEITNKNFSNGLCYTTAGVAQTCNPGLVDPTSVVTFGSTSAPALPASCGGGPCQLTTVENGLSGLYNAVKPQFYSASLTDEWRPNEKLLINLGVRYDDFNFTGADTNGPMRAFWFAAYNTDKCVDPTTGAPIDKSQIGGGFSPLTPCASIPVPNTSLSYRNANLVNASGQQFNYPEFQPRFAFTYTVNPNTVVRGSAGRFVEPPNTAYEQYDAQQQDTADLLGSRFYKFGFNTPGHMVSPPASNNYDLSIEQRLKGTDWSYKLTPFYRHTQNQIQNFYLDQKTGFISGLNVGSLTADGVEFQVSKGDFARNGLSGLLSFTYTNAYIKYGTLANGSTILSQTNQDIRNYNAYTSYCASNPSDQKYCAGGTTANGVVAAPCYTTATATATTFTPGTPIANSALCGAGTVANPYWNAHPQAVIDAFQNFVPYDIFPGGINSEYDSYNVPYVATFLLNYRHDKFAITPSVQFQTGNRYGAPETTPGFAPEACTGTVGSVAGDPRYAYGGSGSAADGTSCATGNALAAIPDPYTGQFDLPGSFRNPSQLGVNLQLSYDVSSRITVTATFANIIDTCWGGTGPGVAALANNHVCSYSILNSAVGGIAPLGNQYNPGTAAYAAQPSFLKYPYEPTFGSANADSGYTLTQPFQFFVEAKIKL